MSTPRKTMVESTDALRGAVDSARHATRLEQVDPSAALYNSPMAGEDEGSPLLPLADEPGALRSTIAQTPLQPAPSPRAAQPANSPYGAPSRAPAQQPTSGRGQAASKPAGRAEQPACAEYCPIDRPPTALLCILDDRSWTDGEWHRLRTPKIVIGRTEGDILLPHDNSVSSKHVEIGRQYTNGQHRWYIHDLGSTNGTFVRVSQAALKEGQQIMIGAYRYAFHGPTQGQQEEAENETKTTRGWRAASPADLQKMMPALVQLTPEGDGERFPLTQDVLRLGADMQQCELVIRNDPFVNPIHAVINNTGNGRWTIKCGKTVNGLWLRVDQMNIDSHCDFQIGEQRCRFRLP